MSLGYIIALLSLICFLHVDAVYFDLPSTSAHAYSGKLFKHETTVSLTPPLRAIAANGLKICGFRKFADHRLPFTVDLLDADVGTGVIRLLDTNEINFAQNKMITFQIEAYDCGNPSKTSERVFVHVDVVPEEDLRFTLSEYFLNAMTFTPIGSVIGTVGVIHEPTNQIVGGHNHCGYSPLAGSMVPFNIDSHGVVRTTEVLTEKSPKAYKFQVQYKDCVSTHPRKTNAVVNVEVIQNECEMRWKGLPDKIDYSTAEPQPKLLLWPAAYSLDMCGHTCAAPKLTIEARLRHALPNSKLEVASPTFCRHDPQSLFEQRKLCEIDATTLVDLLPNPKKDIWAQHLSPAVGSLPRVVPLSHALRFSAKESTGWRLDTRRIVAAANAAIDHYVDDPFPRPVVRAANVFERDFTVSFWLQREPKGDNDHETILCSQEDSAAIGRALWISLKGCNVMVQMTTRNPSTNHPETGRAFRTYFFPSLPENICSLSNTTSPNDESRQWHHYAISVMVNPETADLQGSTLMVDGEIIGYLEAYGQPIFLNRPTSNYFTQFITVGTCYEPSVPAATQSLNGAVAGLTLLMGKTEDQSISRCLAECGETLLIPRASSLITDNVNVQLNNDDIIIDSTSVEDATALLSHIAYVKPLSTSTQLTFTPLGTNSRVLELHTSFYCEERQVGNITMAEIAIDIQEVNGVRPQAFQIETAPLPGGSDASSWVPKREVDLHASPISGASRPGSSRALVLSMIGQETVRADVPVLEPGVTMFPELTFTFTNAPSRMKAIHRAAAMFMLDQCLVLPTNGSVLNFESGERIVWSSGRAFDLGIEVEPLDSGVLLKGHHTANQYASLLHGFRYWPPVEIDKKVNDKSLAMGLLLERNFQLICSYNGAGSSTDPFTVKILLTSPVIAADAQAGATGNGPVVYVDNSRAAAPVVQTPIDNLDYADQDDEDFDDEDDFYDDDDDDDDDDMYDDMMLGDDPNVQKQPIGPVPVAPVPDPVPPKSAEVPSLWIPEKRQQYGPTGAGHVQFAHSDKELRDGANAFGLNKRAGSSEQLKETRGTNHHGLAIGLSVGALAVMLMVVAFFIRKSNAIRKARLGGFAKSDRRGGRLQFRPETSLNVIENPIEKIEGGRLNWQPPAGVPGPVLSEGLPRLPGVHGTFVGHADEQFDAETRSFDGLFEDEDVDESTDEAAALEEVDDFEESETAVVSHPILHGDDGELEGDDEGASEAEDETSFSMGPNHLEFVTLPSPRRGFNPDVAQI